MDPSENNGSDPPAKLRWPLDVFEGVLQIHGTNAEPGPNTLIQCREHRHFQWVPQRGLAVRQQDEMRLRIRTYVAQYPQRIKALNRKQLGFVGLFRCRDRPRVTEFYYTAQLRLSGWPTVSGTLGYSLARTQEPDARSAVDSWPD